MGLWKSKTQGNMIQLLRVFRDHKIHPSASTNPITTLLEGSEHFEVLLAFAPDKQISAVVLLASLS